MRSTCSQIYSMTIPADGRRLDFMPQSNQEYTARKVTPEFDCQLPPEVRAELLRPRRARMLTEPPRPKPAKRAIAPAFGYLLLLLAAIAIASLTFHPAPLVAVHPTPTAQPTPTVHPTVAPQKVAPCAQPAVPRATLVALPEWRVGEARAMRMPYGLDVVGRLKGHAEDELYLPLAGNRIGDTYLVENRPWIWITVPGTTAPAWVDP
jgi:hypothetical protein